MREAALGAWLWSEGQRLTKAKVLGGKRVAHFTRPRIEGMALKAKLHPDRVDLLPKMLLGIAEDVLRHVVRQQVVRFIVDGDTRHGKAPRPAGHGAARGVISVQRRTDAGARYVHASKGARGTPSPRQAADSRRSQERTRDHHTARVHPLAVLRQDGRAPQPQHLRHLREHSSHAAAHCGHHARLLACIGAMPLRQDIDHHLGIGVPIIRVLPRHGGRIIARPLGCGL